MPRAESHASVTPCDEPQLNNITINDSSSYSIFYKMNTNDYAGSPLPLIYFGEGCIKPHYYPISAFAITGTAYIYCIGYALYNDIYIGGIKWPFFSDTGRDKPNYYVFATALSISGFLLMITYYYMYRLIKELNVTNDKGDKAISKKLLIYSYLGTFFGFFIGPFMAMTGIFDDVHSPDKHFIGAYGTFATMLLNMIFYTTSFYMLSKSQPENKKLKFSSNIKLFLMAILAIGFILYVPVGEFLRCPPRRLSYDECVNEQNLGVAYCQDLRIPNHPENTYLWDYTTCTWAYSMSAILQCICVVTGYLYVGSLYLDLDKDSILFMKTMYQNMDDSQA